jgi:hypothetical protein
MTDAADTANDDFLVAVKTAIGLKMIEEGVETLATANGGLLFVAANGLARLERSEKSLVINLRNRDGILLGHIWLDLSRAEIDGVTEEEIVAVCTEYMASFLEGVRR